MEFDNSKQCKLGAAGQQRGRKKRDHKKTGQASFRRERKIHAACYPLHFLPASRMFPRMTVHTMDYLTKILNARVYDVAVETPLELAANRSARCGNRILFGIN